MKYQAQKEWKIYPRKESRSQVNAIRIAFFVTAMQVMIRFYIPKKNQFANFQ